MTRVGPIVAAVLAAACVGYAARVASHTGLRLELRRAKIAAVSTAASDRVGRLDGDVLLSYYVSSRDEMPADLARIEDEVTLVLESLARASGGRVEYRVSDPADDPELLAWLDGLGVSPFRARRVERDGWVERPVWSTLHIAYGARPSAFVRDIGPELVPHLQTLVLGHLDQLEAPRLPVIGLAAPDGYGELEAFLRTRADVVPVDFDARAEIPADVDALFWIDPEGATPAHLAALEAHSARGRAALVAGSANDAVPGPSRVRPTVRFEPTGFPAESLLSEWGLRPARGLVLDAYAAGPVAAQGGVSSGAEPEPYRVRCIAPNQDFRPLAGQPNGSLCFETPTAVELDGPRLAAIGRHATVLATTSSQSWALPVPAGEVELAELAPGREGVGAKRALAVLLEGDGVGDGPLAFFGSSTPFQDGQLGREGFAHRALVLVLVDAFGSDERLVLARSSIASVARVAELPRSSRLFWRATSTFLVPVLLVALAVVRRASALRLAGRRWFGGRIAARGVLAFALVLAAAAVLPRAGLDWTRDRHHSLSPETVAIVSAIPTDEPVRIELVFSSAGRLPPELRPWARRAGEVARSIAALSRAVSVRDVDPAVADLGELGVEVTQVTSTFDEVTTARRIVSAVRVVRGDHAQVLAFADPAAFEHLELRLTRAIERALGAPRVVVAVACDSPRLSPAEALFEYQRLGLFAPSGSDVYAPARAALARVDFDVVYVDPERPNVPAGADVLVWLQPRRDVRPMLAAATAHLARGGGLIVAAQHYDLQRRESEGGVTWWPQPQFPDLDAHYFAELGIELVREVLFDELAAPLDAEGERAPAPFALRAVAANRADSPLVRGVGDLLFASGNRLRWDAERLASRGIEATPVVFTSERAWAYAWSGGDLSAAALRAEGEGVTRLDGRQPLAVLFEGTFPRFDPSADETLVDDAEAVPGALFLLGASKPFQAGFLEREGWAHASLLVQAVAHLALGEAHARIVSRRPAKVGFGYVPPGTRLAWRGVVIAATPMLALVLAGAWRLARRRTRGGRA